MAKAQAGPNGGRAREIAPGVACLRVFFVNVFFLDGQNGWVLIDAGWPKTGWLIKRAAEQRYGEGTRPEAIVLTHGHFDHAGAALELAEQWHAPVYAHPLELPYLTGKSDYPPQDPTVGGALAFLSRTFPHAGRNLGEHIYLLPDRGVVPALSDWRWIHTPGHTAGHVSLFRERDGVLIAGDALATENQDSFLGMLTHRRRFNRPPAPFTTDWGAARDSLRELGRCSVTLAAASHGLPMPISGTQLLEFVERLQPPRKGGYVVEPAHTDETGVVRLPPPARDWLPKLAAGLAVATIVGATAWKMAKRS